MDTDILKKMRDFLKNHEPWPEGEEKDDMFQSDADFARCVATAAKRYLEENESADDENE